MKSFSIGEKKLAKSYVVYAENADNAVGDDEENEVDARMKDSNTKSIGSVGQKLLFKRLHPIHFSLRIGEVTVFADTGLSPLFQ